MSPPRRYVCSSRSRSAGIIEAVRRTRRVRRLRKRITIANSSWSKASSAQTNGQEGGISQDADNMSQPPLFEKLPEDILHRIHSLLLVQDAACAACVSRAFLSSWRSYSKLILSDDALRLSHIEFDERKNHLINKVDKIIKNHHDNDVKVESLDLILTPCSNIKTSYLDKWLRRIVKSGFKKLYLEMPLDMDKNYNFPCSVLSDKRAANSIQFLHLMHCSFQPTSKLGSLTRLKILIFSLVHITEKGLADVFSKCSILEELKILSCDEIICLKIPLTMRHLKSVHIQICNMLRVVDIDAPNLRSFHYHGALPEIYVKNCSQLQDVQLSSSCLPAGILSYARARLPSIARNVESLILVGCSENANTPMLRSKLPHLKNLEIELESAAGFPSSYDVFSVVSFLDAAPALESFILRINHDDMACNPVVGDVDECSRQVGFWHNCLKQVIVAGFYSAKSLVELTVHILESTRSLERLTLDTTCGYDRRIPDPATIGKCPNSRKTGRCWPMSKPAVEEAHRAVKTAARYITGKVPLGVQFEVLEPCSRCHTGNQ